MSKQRWLKYTEDLESERLQCVDEGKDIGYFEGEIKAIQTMDSGNPEKEKRAAILMDHLDILKIRADYPYSEPSELSDIKNEKPLHGKELMLDVSGLTKEKLTDKVYGAWLGRCAGCLLGQPVEGWFRERITGLLRDTNNFPIRYYISSEIPRELLDKYDVPKRNWINNVQCMPEDDDTNYTIIGLKVLEKYGMDFTPDDVAEAWLTNLPILHVCTAERIAYRNLVNGLYPPESASFRNPYREWIGAQIRADFFGYITSGNPVLGAEMAWRDASISHVKNGIYGEMFVAAMLSAAAVIDDLSQIIDIGLSQIPEKSRLAEAVKTVLTWKQQGLHWEQAVDRVHQIYHEKVGHHWCHTLSNAMIVCLGLLFGESDFEKSIGIAVASAFDTDCNGATVGSIIGMVLGAAALPKKWIEPLHDQIKSGVDGFGLVNISELALRTIKLTNYK